jgi:DNA (cytosine-5)-methyltransferase 1
MPYELTEEQRDKYRATSVRSQARKRVLLSKAEGVDLQLATGQSARRLDPSDLMPELAPNGITCLSLFSGGGGLDVGFERAGFEHSAAFELLDICGSTLRANRPTWNVYSGALAGDVTKAKFGSYKGVDIVHGGPPCQPFSIAGKQAGSEDPRNMWGEFVRCVNQTKPRAFIAENVVGLLDPKFANFVQKTILDPLSNNYTIFKFKLAAHDFGVPQSRRRVFFVGFRAARDAARFSPPAATHGDSGSLFGPLLPRNTVRASLGLPPLGADTVAPTLRSGFTGPRNTTSILNSKASQKVWQQMGIWPNGVQLTPELAAAYPPENGHVRMSVADCALLQGFPENWKFSGAAYQVIGQIGNSVCPPVAYAVARQVARALGAA